MMRILLVVTLALVSGCATVEPTLEVAESGRYQARWVQGVLGETANLDACLSRFAQPAAVFHASKLDGHVLGLMVIDGVGEAHACTVRDAHVLEAVDVDDITVADLRGTPRYVPGGEEPEAATRQAYRDEAGEVIGWVYWL